MDDFSYPCRCCSLDIVKDENDLTFLFGKQNENVDLDSNNNINANVSTCINEPMASLFYYVRGETETESVVKIVQCSNPRNGRCCRHAHSRTLGKTNTGLLEWTEDCFLG